MAGAKGAKPAKPAVLDQKGCEFRPDVLVMAPGEMKILNSDGVLHNIHTFSTANPPINKAQPKFKKEMVEKFEKPELIKVQCDAHSWMLGWIYVTENPTAVTDGNGAFKLENVPAGKHKVEVFAPGARQADQGSRGQGRAGHQGRVRAEEVGPAMTWACAPAARSVRRERTPDSGARDRARDEAVTPLRPKRTGRLR